MMGYMTRREMEEEEYYENRSRKKRIEMRRVPHTFGEVKLSVFFPREVFSEILEELKSMETRSVLSMVCFFYPAFFSFSQFFFCGLSVRLTRAHLLIHAHTRADRQTY